MLTYLLTYHMVLKVEPAHMSASEWAESGGSSKKTDSQCYKDIDKTFDCRVR